MTTVGTAPASTTTGGSGRRRAFGTAVVVGAVLLATAVVASISLGARTIPPGDVLAVLTGREVSAVTATIVLDSRLPRTLAALLAGAALAVAGALVQALTRNPLADPGVLGITPGSAFLVALGVGFAGVDGPLGQLGLALLGAIAALAAVVVIGAAGGGADPARTTLAGIALGAVLTGITSGIVLTDPRRFQAMTAWRSGDLAGRGWAALPTAAPLIVLALVVALLLARPLDALALGDESAASLGTRIGVVRIGTLVPVALLAGSATAVAGPIVFVGLMVPHVARWIVGPSQRRIMVLAMLFGAVLLIAADVVGRLVALPGEVPAGLITAVIGGPVLIGLVRRRRASTL